MRSNHVNVLIHLARVRQSAEEIRRATGVQLIAVIKSDAYGLGAKRVADVLAGVADDFAYFTIDEAAEVGRPGIVLGPPDSGACADDYRGLRLRPVISRTSDVERFRGLPVVVSVDSGMQRFGCPLSQAAELVARCGAREMCTHASNAEALEVLRQVHAPGVELRHAASTAFLGNPAAWFEAVRPGVGLYRGAVTVTTRLVEARETYGPVGYTRFEYPHVGVILAGYSNRVAPAPVLINGRMQRILEVGMNTSFVSLDPRDRAGDVVTLLSDELNEAKLAAHFGIREHEVLCRYTSMGGRRYRTKDDAPAAEKLVVQAAG